MEGQSSIRKVCSFGSQGTEGKFCFISREEMSNPEIHGKVNELHYSSITYSNREVQNEYSTVSLSYGNISFLQNNISRNVCQYNTAFMIGMGNGYSSSITYSIISENYGDSHICLTRFKSANYKSIVFINNTVSEADVLTGMIYCQESNTTLEKCFIANNKQNGQYLFGIYGSNNSITVSSSYIDTSELLYQSKKQVTIISNRRISLELYLHSTELCPNDFKFAYFGHENKITDSFHIKFAIHRRR